MPLVSYSSSYDYGPCLCYRCRYTGLALVVLNTGLTLVIVAVAGLALALVAGAAAAVQIRALPLVSYGPCPCRPCHSHMECFVLLSNVLPHHDRLDSPDHFNDRSISIITTPAILLGRCFFNCDIPRPMASNHDTGLAIVRDTVFVAL